MKIALFGGSFDPVHRGHASIITHIYNTTDIDKIIIIPCDRSPLKKKLTDNNSRLKMLELAFNYNIKTKHKNNTQDTTISTWEIDKNNLNQTSQLPPPSYSWETIQHFKNKYTKLLNNHDSFKNIKPQLHWILGQDQWEQLDKWKNTDYLKKNTTFIIYPRNNENKKIPHTTINQNKNNFKFIKLKDAPKIDISSTEIRNIIKNFNLRKTSTQKNINNLEEHKNKLEKYLNPKVLDYILEKNLYSE